MGKVIGQTPPPGTEIACNSKVTLVVGAPAGSEGADTLPPDLLGKTDEKVKVPQNGKPSDVIENGEPAGVIVGRDVMDKANEGEQLRHTREGNSTAM